MQFSIVLGYNSQRTLIRPDPSFTFNPSSSSDSDDDSNEKQYSRNTEKFPLQYSHERLRGSGSVTCIPSSFQSHYQEVNWRHGMMEKDAPILSSPNNLRRHTLGQQHLLKHQKQRLLSQQQCSQTFRYLIS